MPVNIRSIKYRRQSRGERTREEILRIAVDIASEEGLEGLTIGRLSKVLGMSKSGLFAHFGSKQDLLLATVKKARDIFHEEVVRMSESVEPGLDMLNAMIAGWMSYLERDVFPGGCFFSAASAEFDGRPGPVRNLIAGMTKAWLDKMTQEAATAKEKNQIDAAEDPEQLAFELHALVQEANWAYQLFHKTISFERARNGIQRRLEIAASKAMRYR
ncbi:MAG: TetR/AcrR family transcriptional regulator [Candidatus Latescibacteria bacterium]|jgi:AcrR family transcriptional regulator|nr:TetR/AcrR family transcriptional regulator [Candidatus Latescibacterota bacterium]